VKLKLKFFASLREIAGKTKETVESDAKTPRELWQSIVTIYPNTLEESSLKVAVNYHYESWDYLLKDGDEVAFIPPVAGG